ncbi:MAG: hypothetical protein IH586_10415 [Anaerolineaceae bacterium]|nr:hypothetical protein [Anaerolineaceae bacterium]
MIESNSGNKSTPVILQILAGLLWLASVAGGLYALYSLSKLALTVYALFGDTYYEGVVTGQVAAIIAALGFIVMFIITGEYHLKHAGERRSWMLFGWVLGIELVIIFAGLLFG